MLERIKRLISIWKLRHRLSKEFKKIRCQLRVYIKEEELGLPTKLFDGKSMYPIQSIKRSKRLYPRKEQKDTINIYLDILKFKGE